MAVTYTTNLGLAKPDYGTDPWASYVNANWDKLDLAFANARFVNTIADLPTTDAGRAYPTIALGYAAKNDGGGGLFVYNAALLATNNTGTIINGWVRMLNGVQPTIWMFGALPGANITTKLQAMLDLGGFYTVPVGTYTVNAQLKFKSSASGFIGLDRINTVFNYTHTAGPVFDNNNHAVTLTGCKLEGLKIVASSMTSAKIIVNWFGMKHGKLKDLWLFGPDTAASWAINIEGTYTVSEATFNEVDNPLIGGVEVGIRLYDGANNNMIHGGRIQLGQAAADCIRLDGSGANRCNANVIDHMEFSWTSAVSYGINIGSGTQGTHVTHNRFESMLGGIVVDAGAVDVEIPFGSNYFSGCTADIIDAAAVVPSLFAGGIFNGASGAAIGTPYGISFARTGTGTYEATISCRDASYMPHVLADALIVDITTRSSTLFAFTTKSDSGVATDAAVVSLIFAR